MSIVPGTEGSAPAPAPQRTRIAAAPSARAPTAVASANSAPAAAPSSGGRYAVQVTSQRSEGEAQTAFRALQAKYPNQLSGRAPIIRRADLGDKGTFYRALVGPFASAEEAAGLCSGLKAAGGNCIVQRN
jgi:cell division septation protein DedD